MSAYELTLRNAAASFRVDLANLTARFWKWWIGLYVEPRHRKFLPYL